MPKKRTPSSTWSKLRYIVWKRDDMCCKKCRIPVGIKDCHIDHIVSGLRGSNKFKNLRTLCRRCHVLRVDYRHRGMIYKALKDGVIPVNWRNHLWK